MGYGSPAWAALIAHIRRDPRSDELRNVAADYLIEHDDPRGEFIVLRNRLAAGNVPPSEYVAVYDRHRELEREQPWAARLASLPVGLPVPFTGFIEHAHLGRDGLERLAELCYHEPITRITSRQLDPLTAALLDTPELDEIEEIGPDPESWTLFASPRLARVHTVTVRHGSKNKYFEAFAASIVRPHRLVLEYDDCAQYLSMLARSPVLDELRVLPLETDVGVAAFTDHPLAKLERLDTTKLARHNVDQLAKNLDQLAALKIGDNASTILPIVIANVHSGNLRELSLVIREADIATVVELVDSAACLRLTHLTVRGLPLPLPIEQAIRKLAFHGHLQGVVVESRPGRRLEIPGVHVIEAR